MDIKQAINTCKVMPSNQSILLVGPHGIGKSQVVRQLAAEYYADLVEKYPDLKKVSVCDRVNSPDDPRVDSFMIDRRLSQMSEGDMIGLPELQDGVTRFAPPAWYMAACHQPRILFFDEINRATPEVMQAAFQIVLDYELNGWKLHPETRVFAAVNPDQGGYAVNAMDPALIDRFAVIELTPTLEDWLDWACDEKRGNILPQITSFIRSQVDMLDPPNNAQPGRKYQSRRSWELLDRALRHAGLDDCYEKNATLHSLALSRVGVEASLAFQDYVVNMEKQLEASDILDKRWSKKTEKKLQDLGAERWNILIEKLYDHVKDQTEKGGSWTDKQAENVSKFIEILPGEHAVQLWNKIMSTSNIATIKAVHSRVGKLILNHLVKDLEQKEKEDKDKK